MGARDDLGRNSRSGTLGVKAGLRRGKENWGVSLPSTGAQKWGQGDVFDRFLVNVGGIIVWLCGDGNETGKEKQ